MVSLLIKTNRRLLRFWFCLILCDFQLKSVWHKVVIRLFKQLNDIFEVLNVANLKWFAKGRYLQLRRVGITASVHKTTQAGKPIRSV